MFEFNALNFIMEPNVYNGDNLYKRKWVALKIKTSWNRVNAIMTRK